MKKSLGELWTCPKCGRKLVGRNMAHSCTSASVADFLRRAAPGRASALYARFERMIAACGPYHVSPAKTRIAFQARVRFANVHALGARGMVVNFALPPPLAGARFTKVEEVVPGWWVHRLVITGFRELDRELLAWLRRSYCPMGMQERLRGVRERRAPVAHPRRRKSKPAAAATASRRPPRRLFWVLRSWACRYTARSDIGSRSLGRRSYMNALARVDGLLRARCRTRRRRLVLPIGVA